jgi:hypothetical protein
MYTVSLSIEHEHGKHGLIRGEIQLKTRAEHGY